MSNIITGIKVIVEDTGKSVEIVSVVNTITAKELIVAIVDKFGLPHGTNGVLIRKLTRKQLLSQQTLFDAGIQNDEILLVDFERIAGGSMEFYPDGRLKKLDVEPEEIPYLANILKEIRNLHSDIAALNEKVTHISAEISEIRDSTVIISGNNSELHNRRNGASA